MPRYLPDMSKAPNPQDLHPEVSTDLGSLSCGDLIMEIFKTARRMAPGQILHVHATDSAAAIDIAAWCAMQNHALLAGPAGEDKSDYYIRIGTKGEQSNG